MCIYRPLGTQMEWGSGGEYLLWPIWKGWWRQYCTPQLPPTPLDYAVELGLLNATNDYLEGVP